MKNTTRSEKAVETCRFHSAFCILHFSLCIAHFAFNTLHFSFCAKSRGASGFHRRSRLGFVVLAPAGPTRDASTPESVRRSAWNIASLCSLPGDVAAARGVGARAGLRACRGATSAAPGACAAGRRLAGRLAGRGRSRRLVGSRCEVREREVLRDPHETAESEGLPVLAALAQLGADPLGFVLQERLLADRVGGLKPSLAAIEESLLALDVRLKTRLGDVALGHFAIPSLMKSFRLRPCGPIPRAVSVVGKPMWQVKLRLAADSLTMRCVNNTQNPANSRSATVTEVFRVSYDHRRVATAGPWPIHR